MASGYLTRTQRARVQPGRPGGARPQRRPGPHRRRPCSRERRSGRGGPDSRRRRHPCRRLISPRRGGRSSCGASPSASWRISRKAATPMHMSSSAASAATIPTWMTATSALNFSRSAGRTRSRTASRHSRFPRQPRRGDQNDPRALRQIIRDRPELAVSCERPAAASCSEPALHWWESPRLGDALARSLGQHRNRLGQEAGYEDRDRAGRQSRTRWAAKPHPLDVLGAGTQGMIGYLIQQERPGSRPRPAGARRSERWRTSPRSWRGTDRDVSPDLQRIRGPYRFSAGIEAYGQYDMLQHGQQPIPAANGTRQRTGSADGKTG